MAAALVCAMASKLHLALYLYGSLQSGAKCWVEFWDAIYVQGGVTFKGGLLFSVYGMYCTLVMPHAFVHSWWSYLVVIQNTQFGIGTLRVT